MNHLKMDFAKSDSVHPDVLLVEKNLSQHDQDYLLAKNISLVHNIKRPLLENISRSTGAKIVLSLDHLTGNDLGFCDSFHVEKFLEDHGSAGPVGKNLTKALMFFEGCSKPLDFAIVLKGAHGDELKKVKRVLQNGFLVAYRLALETSFLSEQGASFSEEFSLPAFDNQSILVIPMSRCIWKGSVCETSNIIRINYYGSFDVPLGQFLLEQLFDQNFRCHVCQMPPQAHRRCYTHQQGSIVILVKKLPEILLPGEKEGRIWTWHRCLRCPHANNFPPTTKRKLMSDAAWGLSFGKFLELCFSNQAAVNGVASCGHSLGQDCLQFYGFGSMVACFYYTPIDVHTIHLPRPKLEFNHDPQDWIKREADEVCRRAEQLFSEVVRSLHQISEISPVNNGDIVPELVQQFEELEVMQQKEKRDFEVSLHQVISRTVADDQPAIDILEINRLRKYLVIQSYVWDQRLIHVSTLKDNRLHGISNLMPKLKENAINPGQPAKMITTSRLSEGFSSRGSFLLSLNPSVTFNQGGNGESRDGNHGSDSAAILNDQFIPENFTTNEQKLKMISNYRPVYISSFRELLDQGCDRLLLPAGINDIVLPVYDDEPTSIIAYALTSVDYHNQMVSDPVNDRLESSSSMVILEPENLFSPTSLNGASRESLRSPGSANESISSTSVTQGFTTMDQHFYYKPLHVIVSFSDNGPLRKVEYTVTCYYSKQFEDLRKTCCPSVLDFIRSLSRCEKWDAQRGKSSAFSAKTLDDRFIIKQVTKMELDSFLKFGPAYFKYLSEPRRDGSATCLAKLLGIYKVTSKDLKGGKESEMNILVMENLFFKRNITRLYDLKGSTRSRYNSDSSGSNKVLLDQNLIEAVATSPIFLGSEACRLLKRAVWKDTSFLSSVDVMDYSLLVGIDEEKHELVVGIIDILRQYTWDKHLETWFMVALDILGGSKNSSPTVISPTQYKKRFRKTIPDNYFVVVPDQ
ncbi:OLC1v1033756C4 [Oldenlandia corymbosa var. corymbosa]|nr:OLC1v1033756C4 [Oldenlandia corymbosa var. corymbosa]